RMRIDDRDFGMMVCVIVAGKV
ncbi:MAG: hypothetical protein QOJ54_3002, partial [Aliidongia sp.]|nr:hypothetical protein [Aliidongia sp.]